MIKYVRGKNMRLLIVFWLFAVCCNEAKYHGLRVENRNIFQTLFCRV